MNFFKIFNNNFIAVVLICLISIILLYLYNKSITKKNIQENFSNPSSYNYRNVLTNQDSDKELNFYDDLSNSGYLKNSTGFIHNSKLDFIRNEDVYPQKDIGKLGKIYPRWTNDSTGFLSNDITSLERNTKKQIVSDIIEIKEQKYTDRSSMDDELIFYPLKGNYIVLPIGKIPSGTFKKFYNKTWPMSKENTTTKWYPPYSDKFDNIQSNEQQPNTQPSELPRGQHSNQGLAYRTQDVHEYEAMELCLNDHLCDSVEIPDNSSTDLGYSFYHYKMPGFTNEMVESGLKHNILIKNYYYSFTIMFWINIKWNEIKRNNKNTQHKCPIFYYGTNFEDNKDNNEFYASPHIYINDHPDTDLFDINFDYRYIISSEIPEDEIRRGSSVEDRGYAKIEIKKGNDNEWTFVAFVLDKDIIYGYHFNKYILKNENYVSENVSKTFINDMNTPEYYDIYKYFIWPEQQTIIVGANPLADTQFNYNLSKLDWYPFALSQEMIEQMSIDTFPNKTYDPMNSLVEEVRFNPGNIRFNYFNGKDQKVSEKGLKWNWEEGGIYSSNSLVGSGYGYLFESAIRIHNLEKKNNNNLVFIDGYVKCNADFTNEDSGGIRTIGYIPSSFIPKKNLMFPVSIVGGYAIIQINTDGVLEVKMGNKMRYVSGTIISLNNIRYIIDDTKTIEFTSSNGTNLRFINENSMITSVGHQKTFISSVRKDSNNFEDTPPTVRLDTKVDVLGNCNLNSLSLAGISYLSQINSKDSTTITLTDMYKPVDNLKILAVRLELKQNGTEIIRLTGTIYLPLEKKKIKKYTNLNGSVGRFKTSADKDYMIEQKDIKNCIDEGKDYTIPKGCVGCASRASELGHSYYGVTDNKKCLTGNSFGTEQANCKLTNLNNCGNTYEMYSVYRSSEVINKIGTLPDPKFFPYTDLEFLCTTKIGTTRVMISALDGNIYWVDTNNGNRYDNPFSLDSIMYCKYKK